MRIQHNIMAMNAYRNYNINTSAVSKNLEKLSSGYRINRAGDDAAGLAISEKMRAQITGLDAATKNVKDGISLVKTAEGAMQEVQDMLNRMVNLATQSANGTYDNEIDRANLQAEVDQLRSEINRIADSANFNGIKLLDGSLEADTTKTTIDYTGKAKLGILQSVGTDPLKAGKTVSTILHKDASASSLSSFEVNLRDVSFTASTNGTITLNIGSASIHTAQMKAGQTFNGDDLAKEFANAVSTSGVAINGVSYSVTADGDRLKFEMNSKDAAKITTAASFDVPDTVTITTPVAADGALKGDVTQDGILNGKQGSLSAGTVWASTYTSATEFNTDAQLADGSGIIIGDTTYILARTDKTFNGDYADNVKVVDLRDLVNANTGKIENADIKAAQARMTEAMADNKMFAVSVDNSGKWGFYEKKDYSGDVKLNTLENIESQLQKFDAMTTVTETVKKGAGKALTLQIGDTSDDFNQLKVSIGDIHTQALGISQISIATQAGAAAAVDTIKKAINTVSSIRGTLGATQNRLEHTQNNLSVMRENIQDAESTIRDTDIAEEMMAYTKNNILVQSAQAMLAQANQIPQGVLQLLG